MDAAELAFAGAARQTELIRAREVSARELVQTYLDRIARLDPELNAYRAVYADRALAEADQADARAVTGASAPGFRRRSSSGPGRTLLLGWPDRRPAMAS